MPANLNPAYREAEGRLRQAVTPEEKIAALEEMLSVMPKHKGTEKLQADLKSRIAKLKRAPRKKPASGGPSHKIPREGAGQVALVGPPNSGKSALVDRLTHAAPEVAPYPFTTREATPGMMAFEDVDFQLVDLPPLSEEYVEHWVYDLIRAADLVWLVLDVEQALEGIELVERLLGEKGIVLVPAGPEGPPEGDRRPGWVYQEALMVLTGLDREGTHEDLELVERLLEGPWSRKASGSDPGRQADVGVSAVTGEGLDELGRATFQALDLVRVYTKEPGKEPDLEKPFALTRGATVEDLARAIHREIAEGLKFARVWGRSVHDGQRVQGGHGLEEGDVVELHT